MAITSPLFILSACVLAVASRQEVLDRGSLGQYNGILSGASPPSSMSDSESHPIAQCDTNNSSNIPGTVFDGPRNNVYHHFCDKWTARTELIMTVDARGNNKDAEGQLRSLRRTPSANPDAYTHYNINLGFKQSDGDKKCTKECVDAFSQIGSACRNTGTQNQLMQSSGSLDVECGVFDYTIIETTPLEIQGQQCYGADDFGPHGDIHESRVNQLSLRTCINSPTTIKRGDPSTNVAIPDDDNGQSVQMNIYWKDNCVLDYPSPDEMSPGNPLGPDNLNVYCRELLNNNWKQCNNKGVGGSIQVGCLVYEFKATHDQMTDT